MKNGFIAVFRLQCLPTEPNISTTVTHNPHNFCLQEKILHCLRDIIRQGGNISTSGLQYPNVSGISIGSGAVVRHQGERLLHIATQPKVVADLYSVFLLQLPNHRPLHCLLL